METTVRPPLLVLIAWIAATALGAGAASPALAHGTLHEQIAETSRQIAAHPLDASLYLQRGELHRLHDELQAAQDDYARAEHLEPQLAAVALCRGVLQLQAGHAPEAEAELRVFLDRAPANATGLRWHGRALLALGRGPEAATELERALPLSARPTPEDYLELAQVLAPIGTGERARAAATLRRGIERLGPAIALRKALAELDTTAGAPAGTSANAGPASIAGWRSRPIAEVSDLGSSGGVTKVGASELRTTERGETALQATELGLIEAALSAVGAPAHPAHGTTIVARGPYLQVGTPTSVIVRWRTDAPTDSRVRYGISVAILSFYADDAALTTEHQVVLTGLSPSTRYYYSVGTTAETLAGGDATTTFATAPVVGTRQPTRIWAIGDSGGGSGGAGADVARVRDAYLTRSAGRPTDVWLMLGDNAYFNGTDAEYQAAVFDMFPTVLRSTVLWPTRGNHEFLYAGGSNDYYDIFTMPTAGEAGGLPSGTAAYYSFDYSNIHFLCLDSEGTDRSPGGAMLTWLASDLAATTQEWKIAYWHHPPYSKGSHDSDDSTDSGGRMRDMRQNALPILEGGGVDLVLCGHSHAYERSCLLHGLYDVSDSLKPWMKLDPGNGQLGGDGAYRKPVAGHPDGDGAVYVVAGSASFMGGGTLNHPVMVASLNVLGSLEVDVDGDRLEARFLPAAGGTFDGFTMFKGPPVAAPPAVGAAGPGARLAPATPNPFGFQTSFHYTLGRSGTVRLSIYDARGRRVATLVTGEQQAGEHAAQWNGRDEHGRPVAAGVYSSILEFGGERRAGKIVVVR